MKKQFFILPIFSLFFLSGLAHANFISYPIHCKVISHDNKSIEIHASVVSQDGAITGTLEDNGDRASLTCQESAPGSGTSYLECTGQWESDASEAKFSTPLFTFAPMPMVQRSALGFNSENVQGLCVRRRSF